MASDPHSAAESIAATLPLEDQVALGIGRMSMRFSALEAMIRHLLKQTLEMDDAVGGMVLSTLSFRRLRDLTIAAFRHRHGEGDLYAVFRGLLNRATALEHRRNTIIHSGWTYSDLPTAMGREKITVTSSGKVHTDQERLQEVTLLSQLTSDIHTLGAEIISFYVNRVLGVPEIALSEDSPPTL